MRLFFVFLFLVICSTSVSASDYFNVTFVYDNDELYLDSVSVDSLESYNSEYYRSVRDFSATVLGDDVLKTYYFDLSNQGYLVYLENDNLIDKEVILDSGITTVYLPYSEETKEIIIRNKNLDSLFQIPVNQEVSSSQSFSWNTNQAIISFIVLILVAIGYLFFKRNKQNQYRD